MNNKDLEFLFNQKFEYKKNINIPKNIYFGTEIEFSDSEYFLIKDKLNNLQNKGILNKYLMYMDTTVCTINSDGQFIGGELKTPKIVDDIENWKNIKKACTLLKKYKSKTNSNCGQHIHFDINILNINGYKENNLMKFLKLWTAFEDIIFKFSCGEKEELRYNVFNHSIEIGREIYDFLYKYNSHDIYSLALEKFSDKTHAVNFSKFSTVEIRIPNGTINEKIIQNNILFFSKLFLYAVNDKFDENLIDYLLKDYDNNKLVLVEYKIIKPEKALLLANLIYDNEKDKNLFLKQYFHAFSKNKEKIYIK